LILFPHDASAWGPVTHVQFGLDALARLDELAVGLRDLLSRQALPFLYGCVSADIVLAKRWGRAVTHSHAWANGIRIAAEASTPRLRAFAMGYGTHLAADTISHNCFVPSKTIESYASGFLRHMYWELRFDREIATDKAFERLRELANGDFSDCDRHFSDRIPTRILDFPFNKRVFDRLLRLQGIVSWRRFWEGVSKRGACGLTYPEVRHYSDRSMEAVMNFLHHRGDSRYLWSDPSGRERLREAERLRKHFRTRLCRSAPPSTLKVLRVAESFAREPFTEIGADRLPHL
jgi:hypothetical protein